MIKDELKRLGRKKARDAIRFVRNLTHIKGEWAGQDFCLLPWQVRIMLKLFGTLREDEYRQHKTCYIEIPKKNGKSEWGAAIALKMLCADKEQGGEVYSAACDREQAGIVFNIAAQMVRNSSTLSKHLKIIDSQKRIVHYKSGSFYRVLSSDVKTKHGLNPSGVIFDELHAQPNRDLWDVLTVGTGTARRQQLIFVMTTAGYDRHSIGYIIHDYAMKVVKGIINDPSFLPVIYGVPEDVDWRDETYWKQANPSMGRIFTMDSLREEFNKAKEMPSLENLFRQLRLNQWTSQQTRWVPVEKWDECKGIINLELLRGRPCYGGLDLGSTSDITAYVLVFPPENGEGYSIVPFFFIPEDNIEKRVRKDRVPYDIWARKGLLILTPGNVTDYNFIETKMRETKTQYNLRQIGFDPKEAVKLSVEMQEEGFEMVQMGQQASNMSSPTKELEKLIISKQIRHDGNPILRWMLDNVMLYRNSMGYIRPDKEKSRDKIDGIVAMIMAIDMANRHPNPVSIYETQGIKTL